MGRTPCLTVPLKDLNGNVLYEKPYQLNSWIKYFSQLCLMFDDSALDFLDQMPVLNHLVICPDTSEVMFALKELKYGKSVE